MPKMKTLRFPDDLLRDVEEIARWDNSNFHRTALKLIETSVAVIHAHGHPEQEAEKAEQQEAVDDLLREAQDLGIY